MLHFTRVGWPKCCGDVMTLFTPADPNEVVKTLTPPERPGLSG